jgi:CheY-like chemotaxis protein
VDLVALVVDDDQSFLAVVASVLNEMGILTVLTALDAMAAVSEAQARRPDVIVVDVGLPDREGVELARELAALPWGPRVVLTSTDPDAGRLLEQSRGVAVPFVPKHELANATLRRLLIGE